MSDFTISVAVEDKFVLFRLNKPDGLLPGDDVLENLIESFMPLRRDYCPLLDVGNLDVITKDVIEFVRRWAATGAEIIVDRGEQELIDIWPEGLGNLTQVDRRNWRFDEISIVHLLDRDDIDIYGLEPDLHRVINTAKQQAPTEEEWDFIIERSKFTDYFDFYEKDWSTYESFSEYGHFYDVRDLGAAIIVGSRYLRAKFQEIGRNSLMTQLALVPGKSNSVTVVPYHAHALYNTALKPSGESMILARPAVLAARTEAIFALELAEFSQLLSDPDSSESHFQRFFERNDTFLRMLGYKHVYPKVVLERDNGTSLQPDFMVEPFDSEFWDVLDLKKPSANLIVGARDRKDFSAEVHQLHAQLREYGSYFDEEKNRKRIFDRYGIKAYKPRLIGVIGVDYDTGDEEQLRRVLTQYRDCRFFTFEQLRQIAERRLLI